MTQLPLSATILPFASQLHRRLLVYSTPAGLVIRPFSSESELRPGGGVFIKWGKKAVPQAAAEWDTEGEEEGIVVDGVGGLLTGFQSASLGDGIDDGRAS